MTPLRLGQTANPQNLILLLHGVGADGQSMAGLADHLATRFPAAAVVAPDAPHAFDPGGFGRQWFSISGVTADNRQGRIVAALPALEQLIDGELRLTGLDRGGLTLVGFSQGAMMALALAAGPRPPASVVALAGRLAVPIAPAGPESRIRPPIFLGHGTADAVVPVAEADFAARRFEAAGFAVTRVIEQGLAHTISPSLALAAADWLARRDLAKAVAA